jgi:hypothetical protein
MQQKTGGLKECLKNLIHEEEAQFDDVYSKERSKRLEKNTEVMSVVTIARSMLNSEKVHKD